MRGVTLLRRVSSNEIMDVLYLSENRHISDFLHEAIKEVIDRSVVEWTSIKYTVTYSPTVIVKL